MNECARSSTYGRGQPRPNLKLIESTDLRRRSGICLLNGTDGNLGDSVGPVTGRTSIIFLDGYQICPGH